MAESAERARLVVHRHEPVTQRPLDAAGDVTLVIEQRVESGPGQPPGDHVRLGDDGGGARGVGEERHLPEDLARPEGREGRPARAVGGRPLDRAGEHGRPPVLDHVEAVGAVALPHDHLARREPLLLELARQARALQPTEVGEEGCPRERRRRVEPSRVVHEWSGTRLSSTTTGRV